MGNKLTRILVVACSIIISKAGLAQPKAGIVIKAEPAQDKAKEQIPDGSAALPAANLKTIAQTAKPYVYDPVDPVFWSRVLKGLESKNASAVIADAAGQEEDYGASTPEGAEAKLALALSLNDRGLTYAAFQILTTLSRERRGTGQGEAALFYLSNIAEKNAVDEEALEILINSGEFDNLHPAIKSFVGYFKAMYALRFGYVNWAEPRLRDIAKGSYWDYRMRYWTAVGEVARNRVDKAFEAFTQLKDDPNTPSRILELSKHQVARILFERGSFQEAYDLLTQLNPPELREKGRLMLERAWAEYYLKDYSKALGTLAALQAPQFDSSISYERYILQMIIFRELCHYPAVEIVRKNFQNRFRDSFRAIHKRKPLREERMLFNMAVLDLDLQNKANLIHELREETRAMEEMGLSRYSFFAPLKKAYQDRDKVLQAELDLKIEKKARVIADKLLDAEEQIQFISYTSKLDALRISRSDEERKYQSDRISFVNFEKIFWPVTRELWWDEVDSYRVLIDSRCNQSSDEKDRNLEKDFK